MRSAFPSILAGDVDHVVSLLPEAEHPPTEGAIGTVRVRGESLRIPHRVYFPDPRSLPALAPTQHRIWSCIYSRHYDGLVRQTHVEKLLGTEEIWVVPFVLQLIGEYVLEIVELIDARRDVLRRPVYREFSAENPAFIDLTKQRAISYWNCYYRNRFARKDEYPGLRLMNALMDAR